MKIILSKIKLYYQEILTFLFYIFVTLIATYPVIFNMNKFVYGPLYGTDNESVIWGFWRFKYVWLKHIAEADFTTMIGYPFGTDLHFGDCAPISIFLSKWFTILTNEVFTFNIIILLSFFLSAVFMYYLVYQFTKNKVAGLISGIVFAFSPYHFIKTWEHLSLLQIQWIPLYVWGLLNLYKKPILKNVLLTSLAFGIIIIFDYTYAYIMSIFTLGFIIFILLYQLKNMIDIENVALIKKVWKVLGMTVAAVALGLLFNSPALYRIFKTMLFYPKTDVAIANLYIRPLRYLFTQSARPLSYLLPSVEHPIFGRLTKSMLGSIFYGRGSIEQTLYLGWTPLIFAFIAFKVWNKKRKNKQLAVNSEQLTEKDNFYIGFFIFSAILAFLFSLPPYFNLWIFKIYFPSFFMYKILPMFRAYARFGILVMLCVSVLAGFGLKYILERIRSQKNKFAFSTFIIFLVLFEFTNIPPFHATDISKPPSVYQWLKGQRGDFAIAEYPLGESMQLSESAVHLDYIFYQRIHQKKLINGAQIGTYAYKIKEKINKIMDAQTPGILKWLGAKYVVIHLDRYKTAEDSDAMDIIGEAPDLSKQKGLKLVKKFNDVEVYEVVALPIEPKVD